MDASDDAQLQQHDGECSMARRDAEVIVSAETYDELSDRLDARAVAWEQLVIEYVAPVTRVRVSCVAPPVHADAVRTGQCSHDSRGGAHAERRLDLCLRT